MSYTEDFETQTIKLWSPLQTRLNSCGQKIASPDQWLGIIKNLQKNGVSTAEIEWSGIEVFLSESAAKRLPINELLDFLANAPPCDLTLARHVTNAFSPIVRYEKIATPADVPSYLVKRGKREVKILNYRDRSFGINIWFHLDYDDGFFGRGKYWTVNVERGRKHFPSFDAEIKYPNPVNALTFGRKLVAGMADRMASAQIVGGVRSQNHFPTYVLPDGENYTEWLITADNLPAEYWGPHFDVPNLIAHVRSTERKSRETGSILVMEEIQSDWNQSLREWELAEENDDIDPIDDRPPENPYRHHWLDASLRMMLLLAARRGMHAIAWLPGRLHAERFSWANADGLKGFYDDLVPKAVKKLAKSWDAQITQIQIPTTTRSFIVKKIKTSESYEVIEKSTGRTIDHTFDNSSDAHACKIMLENPAQEDLLGLLISEEMRTDLIKNGLPCMGAIGKRNVEGLFTRA